VAERVVELLEVVEVEQEERERAVEAARALDLLEDADVEVAAAVQPGQPVDVGERV